MVKKGAHVTVPGKGRAVLGAGQSRCHQRTGERSLRGGASEGTLGEGI